MANSKNPDQTGPSGAVWSGSTLIAYAILSETLVYGILGHIPYHIITIIHCVDCVIILPMFLCFSVHKRSGEPQNEKELETMKTSI